MKSENGITLASLVIYIVVILMVIVTLTTITSYFQKNVKDFNTKTTSDIEFDKFNLYFVEEVKKTGNKVIEPTLENSQATRIKFSLGNIYQFKNNAIYLNSNVKIAENVGECKFSWNTQNEKQVVTVYMKIGEEARTTQYTISNEKDDNEDNLNYIYGYKRVEGASTILLQNSLESNLLDYKIYGTTTGLGTKITNTSDENYGKYKIIVNIKKATSKKTEKTNNISDYNLEQIKQVEIILDQQLKKQGDIVEYIDFKNQKIVTIAEEDYYSYYGSITREYSVSLPTISTIHGDTVIDVQDVNGNKPSKIDLTYYID